MSRFSSGAGPRGGGAYVIGELPLHAAIEEAGFGSAGANADVIVLGFDGGLTYDKLRIAIRAALAGAAVIATNPDPLTPVADGYDPCVGVLIAAVLAAAPTADLTVVGKPEPFLIEQAVAFLGAPKAETIMIGDQIATDIVAGQRAGLRSVLFRTDAPTNVTASTKPDWIVKSLLDLVEPSTQNRSS